MIRLWPMPGRFGLLVGSDETRAGRRWLGCLITTLALTAATGCDVGDQGQSRSGPVDSSAIAAAARGTDTTADANASGEPFDSLVLAELRRIGAIEEVHVSRCMADAGFDFVVSNPAEPSLQERIVGVLEPDRDGDTEYRATQGYGYWTEADLLQQLLSGHLVGDDNAGKANQARIEELSSSERERWNSVLYGPAGLLEEYRDPSGAVRLSVPSAGCYAAARRQMWGDLQSYLRVKVTADDLRQDYMLALEKDPDLAALEETWSVCMSERGYSLARRADAYTQALEGYRSGYSDQAKSSELAIAKADAECVVETSYTERHAEIQSAVGTRFRAANQVAIDQVLAELRAAA